MTQASCTRRRLEKPMSQQSAPSVPADVIFSTKGGRFHQQAEVFAHAWLPTLAVCGRKLTPVNYFNTPAEADAYTGGRLAQFMCKHCTRPPKGA